MTSFLIRFADLVSKTVVVYRPISTDALSYNIIHVGLHVFWLMRRGPRWGTRRTAAATCIPNGASVDWGSEEMSDSDSHNLQHAGDSRRGRSETRRTCTYTLSRSQNASHGPSPKVDREQVVPGGKDAGEIGGSLGKVVTGGIGAATGGASDNKSFSREKVDVRADHRGSASSVGAVEGEIGFCAQCQKSCALLRSGLVHQHGPRGKPCSGSGREAAPGSRRPAPLRANLRDTSPSSSQDNSSQDFFMTARNDGSTDTGRPISHPRRNIPILKRIPRGARTEAATALQQLLSDVVKDANNIVTWERLLGFAPACLAQPGRGGKSRNLTTLVNRQIRAYDGHTDIGIGIDKANVRKIRRVTVNDDAEAAKRASTKLEEGDVRGAVCILSSKDTVAPVNISTTASLRALHPPAPADLRPTTDVAPLQATALDVRAAIASFPNGSAGGPDRLRPQHLKDLLAGAQGTHT